MKKVLLLSSVIAIVALSSCKKNYTCTCKDSNGNVIGAAATIKATKSTATTDCNDEATTYSAVYGSGVTCSIN